MADVEVFFPGQGYGTFSIFKCLNHECGYMFSTRGSMKGRRAIFELKNVYTCLLEDKGYPGYKRFVLQKISLLFHKGHFIQIVNTCINSWISA